MKAVFDPEKIERELYLLERERSLTETRTSLFNLIIIGGREDEDEVEENLLGHLLGKRAARVIHITLDTPGPTQVSVSARCAPDRENKGVCFQEILIADGLDGAGTAPGSWSAFLIRDIPVYVLWRSPFAKRDTLLFAREQADKFIIDGEFQVRKLKEEFAEYLHRVKEDLLEQGIPVADFAWERFRPLRSFTARVFDSAEPLKAIPDIRELVLSGTEPVSLRLHSLWIAASLGWKRQGEEFSTGGGRRIPCTFQVSEAGETRTTFRFQGGDELDISVALDGVGVARRGGKELLSKALILPHDGEILLQQVDMPGFDGLYGKALDLL